MSRAAVFVFALIVRCGRSSNVDTTDAVVSAFEHMLKKNVSHDQWLCEVQRCDETNENSTNWKCVKAGQGQEHLIGLISESCFREELGVSRVVGRLAMAQFIQNFVDSEAPIQFALPAFPYKSRNHVAKTSGELPDMGEALSIARLGNFCAHVGSVYPKGAHITIVSDGHVFNDVAGVSDCALDAYTQTIQQFIGFYGRGCISWAGLDTFITADDLEAARRANGSAPLPVLKRRALEMFLKPEDFNVDERIKHDADYRAMFLGFLMFKTLDFGDMLRPDAHKNPGGGTHQGFSRKSEEKFLSAIAKKQMLRNQAYNRLLESRLHCGENMDLTCIRLSIHPHPNDVKFGINLVVGQDSTSLDWPTPWHNVVVMPHDFVPTSTAAGFPDVADRAGKPLPLQALEKRWDAEHSDNALPVDAAVVSPKGYVQSVSSREFDDVKGNLAPGSLCPKLDAEIPFWVCVARMEGYKGTASYVTKCNDEQSKHGLEPLVRPFFWRSSNQWQSYVIV
eukprot:TRINITY_DN18009_c1_g1_i1.p1 TRINITY_DN18009_c1_g1~~TRINITY_DN18009_c1_g1_i1.p1  ORF type:complete len:520 (-),score=51.49 TRINITY_DN18009_c1_g1_i1:186-1706(-)